MQSKADTAMCFFRKHLFVGVPKVAEDTARFVFFRDARPQFEASLFATVSDHKCHNLACPPTQGDPQPMTTFCTGQGLAVHFLNH